MYYFLVVVFSWKWNWLENQACCICFASHEPLLLNHVLHVPHIAKNLLRRSQLLTDNNVIVEFVDNDCFIKASNIGVLLLKGIAKESLYQIQDVSASSFQALRMFL